MENNLALRGTYVSALSVVVNGNSICPQPCVAALTSETRGGDQLQAKDVTQFCFPGGTGLTSRREHWETAIDLEVETLIE